MIYHSEVSSTDKKVTFWYFSLILGLVDFSYLSLLYVFYILFLHSISYQNFPSHHMVFIILIVSVAHQIGTIA